MRKLHLLRYGVLMVLLAFLAACGPTSTQPDPKPDPDPKPTIELPEPNPVAVEAYRSSDIIETTVPVTGGTFEIVAEEGTTYRLTITDKALLSEALFPCRLSTGLKTRQSPATLTA